MLYSSLESSVRDDEISISSKPNERGECETPTKHVETNMFGSISRQEDEDILMFLFREMSAFATRDDIRSHTDEEVYQYATTKAPPSILETLSVAQLKEARKVRQVLRNLGYKSQESIEHLVKHGFLVNMPVTSKVFKVVDAMVGKPPEVVQGKAKRRKDFARRDAETLDDHELALEWDLMYVYTHTFLLSVTVPYSHSMVVWLGCGGGEDGIKDIAALQGAATEVIAYYRSKGFRVRRVIYDGERAFSSGDFDTWIRERGVTPNPLASGRHATRVERKIGHIRARMRTVQAGLPYSLPVSRVPSLVKAVVVLINNDSCKANEKWKPPQMCIGDGQPIDYSHIFGAAYGDYCLVYHDNTSASVKERSRADEGIALFPDESRGRGWWFWFPSTDTIRCRPYFEVYETFTESILRDIHECYVKSVKKAVRVAANSKDNTSIRDLRVDKEGGSVAVILDRDRMNFQANFAEQRATYTASNWLKDLAEIVEYEALSFATQYSLTKGVKVFGNEAMRATKDEIAGIINREVLLGKKFSELSKTQRKKIIRAKVIITEKFKNGVFERLKARLVALGNLQDKTEYTKAELSSPTPSSMIVLIQIALAAMKKKSVYSFDIGQAFLNSEMSEKEVFIRLTADVAKIMTDINEEYRQFVNEDGTMIVQLNKALYGIVEAPRLWYDTFCAFLIRQGFKRSELDSCYFFKRMPSGELVDLSVHVDDGLMTSTNQVEMDRLLSEIEKQFHIVKVNKGKVHDYLSMHLVFKDDGTADVSQPSKAVAIVQQWHMDSTKTADRPHDENLFKVHETSVRLDDELRKKFHSSVQSCLFLSVKTRPDIQCAVNYLTTRVKEPTEEDLSKLMKVVQYLNGTVELGITLGGDDSGNIDFRGYADAAYGVHTDAKSHSGIYITLGLGPVLWKSIKQKCVTRSSCEAELVALSELTSLAIWVRDILREIGELDECTPVKIMEDNKAAIDLVTNGSSTSERSRHVHIRNCFVHQFVASGEFKISYCPTEYMIADIFTKPLTRAPYCFLRDYLLGRRRTPVIT